ncbi:LOG family protein [Patescibacteria group bacterium]|nr:LOG family protein [Patescibacteria group bacterium]
MKKTKKIIKRVTFFGDGEAGEKEKHYQAAKRTARLLAENGYIIVNGGGPGVMRAATEGAKEGGGRVEVVVLAKKSEPDNYEGVDQKNLKMADKIIEEESYPKRIEKLMELGDAFVIFKGGTGTISEIGMAWNRAKYDYGHHEPLIFFGQFWQKIVVDLITGLNLEKKEREVVGVVTKAEQVLALVQGRKEK